MKIAEILMLIFFKKLSTCKSDHSQFTLDRFEETLSKFKTSTIPVESGAVTIGDYHNFNDGSIIFEQDDYYGCEK